MIRMIDLPFMRGAHDPRRPPNHADAPYTPRISPSTSPSAAQPLPEALPHHDHREVGVRRGDLRQEAGDRHAQPLHAEQAPATVRGGEGIVVGAHRDRAERVLYRGALPPQPTREPRAL